MLDEPRQPGMSSEDLFQAELPLIERQLASTCRIAGLTGEEAVDFCAWAKKRLARDGGAILRRDGDRTQSTLSSYLATQLQCLLLEYRAGVRPTR